MPAGIIATDDGNGFVTLDFVDKSLRGPALAKLVEIGGAATIETVTRVGPRRQYRVPAGNAAEAGLLDEAVERVRSAGYDTGAAQALVDADPNKNAGDDGADWHTPVGEYTSANSFVGQVDNAEVLHDRAQVHTGDAESFGGQAEAPIHRDVIDHALENSTVLAVGGVQPATEVEPRALVPVSQINASLADQDAALGSDPGARPDAGGEFIAEGYTSPQQTREDAGSAVQSPDETGDTVIDAAPGVTPEPTPPTVVEGSGAGDVTPPDTEDIIEYPEGNPTSSWTRPELDAYALRVKGLDTSGLPNKTEVLAAINNAPTPGQ